MAHSVAGLILVFLGILIGGTLASALAIASAKTLISQLPWKQERSGDRTPSGKASSA